MWMSAKMVLTGAQSGEDEGKAANNDTVKEVFSKKRLKAATVCG